MDYKQKYYKYKKKYSEARKEHATIANLLNPDIERATEFYQDDIVITSTEPDYPYYPMEIPGESSELMDETVNIYKVGPIDEYQRKILREKVDFDVGFFGLARGRQDMVSNYGKNDFIKFNDKSDKSKVLRIDNIDDFDDFTYKYGSLARYGDIDKEYGESTVLYIKWNFVAKKYKGILIDKGINAERFDQGFYKGKWYKSWWSNEYPYDEVVIFLEEDRSLMIGKNIDSPFKGKIYGHNDFTENDYTNIFDKNGKNRKILILDNFRSFDTFTSKYGTVKKGRNNVTFVSINWKQVAARFRGFYIDPNSKLYPKRYIHNYIEGDKYVSWWRHDKIKNGVVYIFD